MIWRAETVEFAVADNGWVDLCRVFQSFEHGRPDTVGVFFDNDVFVVVPERLKQQIVSIGLALSVIENIVGFRVNQICAVFADLAFQLPGGVFPEIRAGTVQKQGQVFRVFVPDFAAVGQRGIELYQVFACLAVLGIGRRCRQQPVGRRKHPYRSRIFEQNGGFLQVVRQIFSHDKIAGALGKAGGELGQRVKHAELERRHVVEKIRRKEERQVRRPHFSLTSRLMMNAIMSTVAD